MIPQDQAATSENHIMEPLRFPSEIILQILRYADKQTLKSLRQCAKWLEPHIIPALFRELVVVPYSTSFEGVIAHLASSPRIRDVVECIRYDTHCLGPDALKLSDASHLTSTAWNNEIRRLDHNYPGYSEYVSSLLPGRFPLSMSDEFRRLVRLSSQGRVEVDYLCEMNHFTALLQSFPNVTRVSLTNSVWSDDGWCRSKLRPVPYFYSKWFDNHKRNASAPDPNLLSKPYTTNSPYISSQRAEFLLLSLCNHGDRRFELQIDDVHSELFTGMYASDDVRDKWDNNCLRNITSLNLQFHKRSDREYRYREPYYTLAHLLTNCRAMQELSITFHDRSSGVQHLMEDIEDNGTMPPLRHLSLGSVRLSSRQFVNVLKLMSSSLRKVKLDHIDLCQWASNETPHDNWLFVIKSMSEHLRLEQVEFSGVLKAHNQQLVIPDWKHACLMWEFKKAKRIGSDDVLRLSRMLNEDLYEYLSSLKFDGDKAFTKDSCLAGQIGRYITHQGPYPIDLVEIDAASAEAAQADASPNWSTCYGDCSWLMGI